MADTNETDHESSIFNDESDFEFFKGNNIMLYVLPIAFTIGVLFWIFKRKKTRQRHQQQELQRQQLTLRAAENPDYEPPPSVPQESTFSGFLQIFAPLTTKKRTSQVPAAQPAAHQGFSSYPASGQTTQYSQQDPYGRPPPPPYPGTDAV